MKQSTSFTQVANKLLTVLQGYTKGIRFVAVLTMLLIVGIGQAWGETITDEITASDLTATGTSYTAFDNVSKSSDAIYAGQSAKDNSENIQLRSKNSNSGIVSTTSGGKVKSVKITVGSGSNTIDVYGSNTAYTGATDLYDNNKQGTKIGSVTSTGTITFDEDYTYVGIRSNSGAIYLSKIDIEWETASAAPLHNITATSNNDSYGTVTLEGTTITATPNAGYRVKSGDAGYTVTSGTADVTNNGDNTFSVTPSSDCTITINFEAIPQYTVTWNVNSEVYETTQVTEGSKPTFPATPSSCDATSNTFYGWATATWDGKINDVSAKTIYTSANDMPAVNGAVSYYAVFAKKETSGSGTAGWSKVTSTSDLEVGATYAISSAETAGNYLSTYTGANNFPNSTTIICKLVLGGSADAWTFKINDASSYNNYYLTATSTTSSNYLKATSTIDNYCKFSISFANTGNAVITCIGKQSRNILRYNSTNNPPIFACYSSGQSAVYLQKYSTGSTTTYSDYITTCAAGNPCDALPAPNVTATATANSITLSWDAVDGATSYNVYNYTTDEAEEVNVLTYTFNGLDPETEYEWEVEAVSATCNGKGTKGTTTTSATPCEQLGAATGLTVVTDFVHTDGKTYVKFSWTPADNTKNYAASQKLCFGKVGEAGTCVDDLAKNLTWTGDLKSKLEPGEYWWSIQALGDGANYCDGDVVNGTNFTIEAPTYTVTFDAGSGTCDDESLTETSGGAGVTLPIANPPAACATDGWEFAGWWTEEVAETTTSPGELLTAGSNYKPASDCTLYAVYSYTEAGGSGSTDYVLTNIEDIADDDIVVITMTYTNGTVYALSSSNGSSDTPPAPTVTISDNKLSAEPADALKWNISNSSGTLTIYPNGTTAKWLYCTNSNDGVRIGTNTNKAFTIDASSGYLKNTNTNRYVGVYRTNPDWRCYDNTTGNTANQTLGFYVKSSGGSTTTYNSNPTCLVPVWDGATIDKTSFTVNCGGRSPMTGANGAAIISFPTKDIYNFTKDITIEASVGFIVSTSQNEDAKYKSSVSLSPLVGTTNANTFNDKHVYVRAEAPAQSDTDLEGTITIKNNKGETLQTFDVTADVTCAQYTLTLVDRGVSTEQLTKYYAGETINEAPADPEGVCTDPIHYVFDGWAEATVDAGATTYTKVTFPYTVTGNTTFYAVYRYLDDGGEPSNDFIKVTKEKDDWTGDYVIVDEDAVKAIGNAYQNTNTLTAVAVAIQDNKVVSPSEAVIWQIRKHGENYTMYNASADNYAYIATDDSKGAGLSATTTNTTQDIQIVFNNGTAKLSGVDIYRCFSYYGKNTEWRTYSTGSYNTGALYCRSLESYLYTTSPICGPHLAITEGKDIYVTGGNAGGTRDLVIAQQKVSYKATRLEKDKSTGNLPSIKALPSNIVFDNTKTKAVAVTFDEDSVRTLQSDGTYTITGNITIAYQPAAANVTDDIQVTLNANYNPSADVSQASFTVHARSLPAEFVIVAKSGDKWYALNGDMNTNAANPANGQVTLDNDANPTKATYAPCNTIYTFDGLPNTGDRTYVRFQGTDGAWLWASSGTNVGIQNNVLKTTPEGSNKAYNWKLYTEDNITYRFGNANSSRQLTLNGEKFGMYASGVQDIRILPYDEKCLYNYAPTNLKVSVLKGTYVTLTWDAVIGATKYQYSTDATNWNDAGTEPTVTINGLTGDTEYTYYIRAYHEDAGVSQECIDYAEITFTTANCDDVPTDITYTADLNSITVSWTAAAQTATIKLYSDENGEHAIFIQNETTSPWKISTLSKNTTYYLQIFSNGTCASQIIPVKTEDVEVDIVEWDPQGIIVDINTDETVGVTLENEVSFGSGLGTEATELFFSKYYEASYNVKLVAIYNGTKNIIDLTDYTIQYGKTEWDDNYITLKDFGATKGQIQPGEEIILYSYTENNADDKKILDCVHDAFPDGNWVRVTNANNDGEGTLSFGGDKTIILCKTEYDDEADKYYDYIIDVIGALKNDPNEGILPTKENTKIPSWGDKEGWVCETGLSIADDSQIGISTNRCLLIRNNTVTSGDNAVTQNIDDFVTLCSEWKGAHVPDNDIDNGVQASCDNFAYVGTFDYSDYYTKYVPMGEGSTFDENARNADGTVTIPITDLYKHACSNIRVKLTNSNSEVLSDREYKVPIMITTTQGTDGQAFIDLRQNLATKEVDGEGNVIDTHPLSLEEVREICKTCDVVVRDNAILTKAADDAADDHPEVRNVYVYENSSLIVPNGTNYTINNLSLRRNQDEVASVSTHPDALKLPESAAAPISLDFRLSAESWHWFTLPYDCNISEVTWVDGSPAQYKVDWFLMTYDGEKRAATQAGGCWKAYTGTTIKAGEGFILAINGNINNPAHTYELRFPMSKEVLAAEGTDKPVDVRAWGVETNIRPNHKGWNLVGNPYLAYYQRNNITNFEGLRLGLLTGPDSQTGYWEQTGDVPYVVVPVGAGWIAYEQVLASETDLLPFTAYFVQVGNDGQHNSSDELSILFDHTKLQLSATPMPASIIQRATSETDVIEPVIVGVSLTNSLGESDKTSLVIDNQFTDEYEMNADFFKWFGDYYKYYTKPVVYSLGADNGKRAFNALSEDLATQPISLGMYVAQAGNYTFTLDRRSDLSKVQEVWLYDATQDKYTNLMQDSYTFNTAKTESAGRFFLSVKMAPKVSTDINNVTDGTIWATTQDHTIFVNGLLSNAQLWIYDATGKLLHTDQTQYYQHTYQVPVSGTYFVRVQNTMQTQTIKVVVE